MCVSNQNQQVNGTPVGVIGQTVTFANVAYCTVWIGDRLWLAENLRGDFGINIPRATTAQQWSAQASPSGTSIYANIDSTGSAIEPTAAASNDQGSLYNYEAVKSIKTQLASLNNGWRIATQKDFTDALQILGGSGNAFKSPLQATTASSLAEWRAGNGSVQGTNLAKFNGTSPGYIKSTGSVDNAGDTGTYIAEDPVGPTFFTLASNGTDLYTSANTAIASLTAPSANPTAYTGLNNILQNSTVRKYCGFSLRLVYEPCQSINYLNFNGLNSSLTYSTSDLPLTGGVNLTNYPTIWIGAQKWMAVNIVDIIPTIPIVNDTTAWANLTTPACSYYNGNPDAIDCAAGLLFNAYAISNINAATNGNGHWRVPTNSDFTELENFLGGSSVAGGKLKSDAPSLTTYWNSPNTGADNSSGFSAIGAGLRVTGGSFLELNQTGGFWTSTVGSAPTSNYAREVASDTAAVTSLQPSQKSGYSVRLLAPSIPVTVILQGTIAGDTLNFGGNYGDGTNIQTTASGSGTTLNLRNGNLINGGSPVTFQAYPASGRVATFAAQTGLVPSNNGTVAASATYSNLIAPITVTVTFSGGSPPQSYTVTFNANANAGVSGTMSPQSSSTATALTLNAYSRVGYTFSGWNTNATGTGTSYGNGAQYPFTSNITLYAVWAQIPVYNVTFDPNGGVAGSGGQTGLGYAGVTIPINPDYTPTRAGFTFTGYWTLPSGGSQVVTPNGNYTFTQPNQTLYAQWSANPVYTITWDGNGGTPAITTSQGTINSVVASPTPTLAGSTFIGWYSQQSGGSLIVSPGAPYTIVSGNNTLYAQWALSQCPSPQNYSPIVNGPNLAALDILGVQYPIGVFNGNQGAGLMNGNITFYNLRAVLPGITLATSANQWQTLSNSGTPACAWYNYTDPSGSGNPDECAKGLYYNWYALSVIDSWLTTNRPGNRVPTSCDYKHIFNALASTNISGMQGCTSPTTFNALGVTIGATFPDNCANSAPNNGTLGKALKSTTVWSSTSGNNAANFTALPAGYIDTDGSFLQVGTSANMWSSSEAPNPTTFLLDSTLAWRSVILNASDNYIDRLPSDKRLGFNVRIYAPKCTLASYSFSGVHDPNFDQGTLAANQAAIGVTSAITISNSTGTYRIDKSAVTVNGVTATVDYEKLVGDACLGPVSQTITVAFTGVPTSQGDWTWSIPINCTTVDITRTVTSGEASVNQITNCNAIVLSGSPLQEGLATSGNYFVINYSGGIAGTYSGQTISSTGVTGLTATSSQQSITTGDGSIQFNISGTPADGGTASFNVVLPGVNNVPVTCTVTFNVTPVITLNYLNCTNTTYSPQSPPYYINTPVIANVSIPYSASNGGSFAGATYYSQNVNGLILQLDPATLSDNTSGFFTGTITGTPTAVGNATFNICIGGNGSATLPCTPCTLTVSVVEQSATIGQLDCNNPNNQGSLLYPVTYSVTNNVTTTVTYTGGNGGTYGAYTSPSSTGVTGLYAFLDAGTFAGSQTSPGSGSLTFYIIGTPSGSGTATFTITIGGQTCTFTREVTDNPGTITSLDCANAVVLSTLISDQSVNNIVVQIPYTGGNGGSYPEVSAFSQPAGINGTLAAGYLATGDGVFDIVLNGTMPPNYQSATLYFTFPGGGTQCAVLLEPEQNAGVAQLDCTNSVIVGGPIQFPGSITPNTVFLGITYTDSDGGTYNDSTFISQGVSGLVATLPAGNFQGGSGYLELEITGTPYTSGTAQFIVNIGGSACTYSVPINASPGSISTLSCSQAYLSQPLINGQDAAGTQLIVPYYTSDGGSYASDTANSVNTVTGVTANLSPGTFQVLNGSLVYDLSGTPSGQGPLEFNLSVANQSCPCLLNVSPNNGTISGLNCAGASFNGSFTEGFNNTVNGTIPYTGGNGGAYAGTSNSQNGLTLTVSSGIFNNGSGNIPFTITGTPVNSGNTTFSITVGGVTCNNLTITVQSAIPIIDDLRCSETVVTGTLSVGQPSAVSFTLNYYGSNQQPYPQNTSNSTGVTGLTATTPNGTLADPTGTLVYTVTGTPQSTGTATFLIIIGTQSCTVTIPVTQPNYFGPENPAPCQEVTYTDPGCEVLNTTCTILVDGTQVTFTTVSNVDPCQVSFNIPCTTQPGTATVTFQDCDGDTIIDETIEISDSTDDSYFTPPDGVPPGEDIVYVDPDCSTVPNVDGITFNGDVVTYTITSTTPPCTILITIPPNATPGDGTFEFTDDNGDVIFEGTYPVLDPPVDDNTFDPPGGALPGDEVTFTNPGCDIVTGELDQILVNGVPATITGTTPAPECSVTFEIPEGVGPGDVTITFVDDLGNVIDTVTYTIGSEGADDGTYTVTFTPQDEGCHLIYFKTTGEDYCVYQADGPFEVGVPVTITINLIDYADCLGTVPPVACADPLRVTGFIRPCCTQDGSKDVDLNFVEYQIRPCKSYQVTCPSGNCGTFTRSNCSPTGCFGYTDSNTYALASGTSIYVCSEGEGVVNTENSIYEISELPFNATKTFFYPSVLPTFDSTNPTWSLISFAWATGIQCSIYNSQPWTGGRLGNLNSSLPSTVSYANPSFLTPGDLYTIRFKMSWSNIVPAVVTVSSGANTASVTVSTGSVATWGTSIVADNGPFSITIPAGGFACLQITAIEKTVEMPINCCYCVNHIITFSHKPSLDVYYSQCNENGSEFIQQTITSGTTLCAVFNSVFPVLKSDRSSMTIDIEDPC